MRPTTSLEPAEPRSRKHSITEAAPPSIERRNAAPVTYFLARGPDPFGAKDDSKQAPIPKAPPVRISRESLDESSLMPGPPQGKEEDGSSLARRRSTITASGTYPSRRGSSAHSAGPSFCQGEDRKPAPASFREISLPSSPHSPSSRSIPKSADDSTSDESKSQAVLSSDEEDGQHESSIQDSAPQLIMPSIKMPSRRPFTARGKRLGRYKVLVAGSKGSGKTSLIKSIVQLCEDIVHVDPLSTTTNTSLAHSKKEDRDNYSLGFPEIYASTKPYPSWWSHLDESRILRRRKSIGDSVLERNVCFVEAASSARTDGIIHYIEQQLQRAINSCNFYDHDFSGLLSGRGGSQVDVILYLLTQHSSQSDCEMIHQLSEMTNVIPLISKSDTLSTDEIGQLKNGPWKLSSAVSKLPVFDSVASLPVQDLVFCPFTISAATGPDNETMDASLLMSSEYVQPLMPSELSLLVDQIFDPEVISYFRHTAAKKLISWSIRHPRLTTEPSPSAGSIQQSTLPSPAPTSLTTSCVLVPPGSDLSLTTSNSYALARVADHAQREERLAQVRLSKWASDLQQSLQRERERYEKLARGERATWLIERMGEEIRDGKIHLLDNSQALVMRGQTYSLPAEPVYSTHDPLGLLRWQEAMRTRGWIALQLVGSFGVVGGLAFWLARSLGFTNSMYEWAHEWSVARFGGND